MRDPSVKGQSRNNRSHIADLKCRRLRQARHILSKRKPTTIQLLVCIDLSRWECATDRRAPAVSHCGARCYLTRAGRSRIHLREVEEDQNEGPCSRRERRRERGRGKLSLGEFTQEDAIRQWLASGRFSNAITTYSLDAREEDFRSSRSLRRLCGGR